MGSEMCIRDSITPELKFYETRKARVIGMCGLAALLICALFFFAYRQLHFSPLVSNISEDEAAPLVEALKERQIKYRLKDGGKTVLVSSVKNDEIRLSLQANGPLSKSVNGFELFDESEMGLTEFAQKIKFQRALQGELSRTVMMMEGIKTARVHLTIPERSLFRSEQKSPKAAITVIPNVGYSINAGQIEGVQRLVSQSVPGLTFSKVVVINEKGAVISPPSDILTVEDNREFYEYMKDDQRSPIGPSELIAPKSELVLASSDAVDMSVKSVVPNTHSCLLYTSPSPRDLSTSRMPSSA